MIVIIIIIIITNNKFSLFNISFLFFQFDKFAKLDPTFYGRTPLGLPGFPSLSPLLTQVPGGSTAGALAPVPAPPQGALTASASTPFAPPGHLAAFQPKVKFNEMKKLNDYYFNYHLILFIK